jgi:hypothetical protein
MKQDSIKSQESINFSNTIFQLYEPLLNFVDWEIDQILIYSDKYFCADIYICEDTGYDDIFVGITYNPIFEIHLEYIESRIINFLVSERGYDITKLDIAKAAFDW